MSPVSGPALIPAPTALNVIGGSGFLHDGLRIEAPDELTGVARWFRQVVERATSWRVEITKRAALGGVRQRHPSRARAGRHW